MSNVIHTQLKVSLLDKVTGPMKKVLESNRKLDRQIKKTNKALEKARGPVKLIKDFKKQNEALKKATEAYRKAGEDAARLREKIASVSRPTKRMMEDLRRLRERLGDTGRKMREQQKAVNALLPGLRRAGVDIGRMAEQERRLQHQFDRTNRLMKKQLDLTKRFAAARERMASGVRGGLGRMAVGGGMIAAGTAGLRKMWAPVQRAVDFEAEFANVVKKANFRSEKAKQAYRQWILEMSGKTPMSAAGIAAISAAAYEGGISNQQDNKRFTEMVIKGSIAWDVSPEEAGKRLARQYKAFGGDLDKLSLHMDRINHLSNTWALSAAELLNYYSRVHAELRGMGFSSAQVSALGAFAIAGDFGPDVVATTVRNMMKPLAAGRSATKGQKKALKRLGLSPVPLARSMSKDAWGTFLDVMRRMQKVKDWERPALIRQLFGAEARAASIFFQKVKDKKTGKMVTGVDYLLQAYRSVAQPARYRGSAEQEYQTRISAADMKFRQLMNQFSALSIQIGNSVLPALIKLTETIKPYVESLSRLVAEHPKVVAGLMGFGAAVLAAKVAVGAFTVALGIGKAGKAMAGYGLDVFRLRKKQRLYGRIGARLAGGATRKFALQNLVKPITWTASLIPPIPWRSLAGNLRWSALITPLRWGARFIPYIGWAALAGQLAWDLLIKPLGWDKYIKTGLKSAWDWVEQESKAGWDKVRNMDALDWAKLAMKGLPNIINRIVEKFTGIDLFDAGAKALSSLWDGMKSIWKSFKGWLDRTTAKIRDAFSDAAPGISAGAAARGASMPQSGRAAAISAARQKKAAGGWLMASVPTLVGERGPELIYPSRAGWVAHNDNLRRLARLATAASVATPLFYSPPSPAVVTSTSIGASMGREAIVNRTVQVTVAAGAIQIHVADMGAEAIADELGRRLGDVLRATMADVEDV